MAGKNYYVLSELCTDEFWNGNERGKTTDTLANALTFATYQLATESAQAFMNAAGVSNIEIRQIVKPT